MDHLTYLGIKVTHSYKKLFEENFTPLLERTKTDFQRWGYLPLSLIGRINVVKMNTYIYFNVYQHVYPKSILTHWTNIFLHLFGIVNPQGFVKISCKEQNNQEG